MTDFHEDPTDTTADDRANRPDSAVLNCCLHWATTGRLVHVADAPTAFALPNLGPPADEDAISQS